MEFKSKRIVLKDGIECLFRSPRASDAPAMNDYIRCISSETDFILRYPEECTESDQQEADWLEAIYHSPHQLLITAFDGDYVLGNCQINMNQRLKTRHRASFAIGIRKAYWNKGLGTQFFREMIQYAQECGVVQGELEFIEGNTRAQALYEKIGFQIYGEKKRAIRLKDGTYLSEFLMVKNLEE
jgi:RimJ/RimL family protein N-acetyltransferase